MISSCTRPNRPFTVLESYDPCAVQGIEKSGVVWRQAPEKEYFALSAV
jgi:hypothetical protein